jgi:hypothetical protein
MAQPPTIYDHVAGPSSHGTASNPTVRDTIRQQKTFNLNTYKHHALEDYTTTIRKYGTTDSYTMEVVSLSCCRSICRSTSFPPRQVELEHRASKARYARTSRKAYVKQLTAIERRQARLCRIRDKLAKNGHLTHETVSDSMDTPYHRTIRSLSHNFLNNRQMIQLSRYFLSQLYLLC